MNRHARRPPGQQGYVLLMVLGVLTVVAFVALRFAQRIDALRSNAIGLKDYASARASAAGAAATTLYWVATRQLTDSGFGDAEGSIRADGQVYRLPDGALISLQDQRGLLSLNSPDRRALSQLLIQDGVPVDRAQAWLDVLQDYIDTDELKRLNGAERRDYEGLGLAPPRNDWLLSVRELEQIPLWRDDPVRLARLSRLLSVGQSNQFNPNTAPLPVLQAVFAGAAPAQLDLLLSFRKAGLLRDGAVAQRSTGLPLDREDYLFAPGSESRLTVWAPGLPRALEYNLRFIPGGIDAPWLITEQHTASRLDPQNDFSAAIPFPLSPSPAEPSGPASSPAP